MLSIKNGSKEQKPLRDFFSSPTRKNIVVSDRQVRSTGMISLLLDSGIWSQHQMLVRIVIKNDVVVSTFVLI
jgi:hypothetical protein